MPAPRTRADAECRTSTTRSDVQRHTSPILRQTKERHMGATPVTDGEWKTEVLDADAPVLVDFWAEWCGPCRMVGPIVDEIADEHGGKLKVLKLNVDENPGTAREYGVMSIPTLMVFKDGQPDKRIVGAKPKSALLADLSEYV
ncbi:MAG: thioredoxin [Actinobacteria bacterium]|nr:thioredoxin [Actinomycetota bacterium]